MRLYKYLNEGFAETVPLGNVKAIIDKHCSKNFAAMKSSGIWLRRGDPSLNNKNNWLIDSTVATRKSAHTMNYYNLLFSGLLDNWKQYPPRNKSLICTTEEKNEYGIQYIVIPFDNTKLGICPDDDIWYACSKGLRILHDDTNKELDWNAATLDQFNWFLMQYLDINVNELQDALKKNVKDLGKGINWKHNKNFKKYLEEILDPAFNNFKLVNNCSSLPKLREIWFSGKCLMLNQSTFRDIINLR